MSDFYHRTEVRDITGHCNSLLFNPDDFPDYRRLKRGSTCFVRYASKAYFSDLMTQVSSSRRREGGRSQGQNRMLAGACHGVQAAARYCAKLVRCLPDQQQQVGCLLGSLP
jgi:hypothetical protein